jgi:hypothetical protein
MPGPFSFYSMNANARFLQEAKDLEAKWLKTGLLEGIDRKWDRQVTAVLLEGQRLINEIATTTVIEVTEDVSSLRR